MTTTTEFRYYVWADYYDGGTSLVARCNSLAEAQNVRACVMEARDVWIVDDVGTEVLPR